ncbi:MAG: FkbM family methyltransferase [Phycisphaerales bacterium]|nr:FkbM family methyltransferase [Phycisphaerales bacterium]
MSTSTLEPISSSKMVRDYVHENASCPILDEGPFNRCIRLWKPTAEYLTNPWAYFTRFIDICKQRDAQFITFSDALAKQYDPKRINILLDHHIDYYPIETEIMCRWELEHGVISNIYLFNEFDYPDTGQRRRWFVEDIDIEFYQMLESKGFEIGYHQNAVGLYRAKSGGKRTYSKTLSRDEIAAAQKIFARDVDNLRKYFNIRTFIPHGAGESNARLLELPEGYEEGLEWVYNNRSRNGTVKPTLKWRSWSDSNGQRPQLIKVNAGHILTSIDNLHTMAWTMEAGINHVLIHPGRFGLGMPMDLYHGPEPDESRKHATPEFALDQLDDQSILPIEIPELITEPSLPGALPRATKNNRYALIDSGRDLPKLLKIDNAITAMLLDYSGVKDPSAYKLVRGSAMRVSEQSSPDSHSSEVSEDQQAIAPYYNRIMTDRALVHLRDTKIPYEFVSLHQIKLVSQRDVRDLIGFLSKLTGQAQIKIDAHFEGSSSKLNKLIQKLDLDGVQKRMSFVIADQTTGRSKKATWSIVQNPAGNQSMKNAVAQSEPKALKGLDEAASALTRVLAKLRSETPEETLKRFGARKLRKLPGGIRRHVASMIQTDFDSTGLDDGYAWAQLPNGRRFFGHPSLRAHEREYTFVADLLSPVIKPETYLISKDVVSRYVTDWGWFPRELLPSEGGRAVEVGAYMGHKTMRLVDECVGRSGKVLALELDPNNAKVIEHNARYNNLSENIDVIAGGVFNADGEQRVITRGRQRNSLVNLDKLNGGTGEYTTQVRTLDTLLESWGEPTIDFMVITANGAELEVLQGLDKWFDRVQIIYIAACYTVDGCGTYEPCRAYLEERGCEILPQSNTNVIYSLNPKAQPTPSMTKSSNGGE